MKYLHRIAVASMSLIIVLLGFHYGPNLLNVLITPLPQNLKSCLSDKFSNSVEAQAYCTGITNTNSVAVWRSDNRLRESTMYLTGTWPNETVGIGATSPGAKFYVRDTDNAATSDIAQFYANNLTQGVGIGYNRIEAVGSNAAQDLYLLPKGTGNVSVSNPLIVNSAITGPGGWNIAMQFSNGSHNAIYNPTGALLFGIHSNSNFYWMNTTTGRYSMTLSNAGGLTVGNTTDGGAISLAGTNSFGRINTNDIYLRSGATTNVGMAMQNSGGGTYGYFYGDGSGVGMLSSGRGWTLRVDDSGNTFATGSHRAPVFYDSENTGFYLDPNGNNRIANLHTNANLLNWPGYNGHAQAYGHYIWPGRNDGSGGDWQQSWYLASHSSYGLYTNTGMYFAGTTYMPFAYDSNDTGYYVDANGTSRMNEVHANRVYGFYDIRSPIFYDYNNTGYYMNPDGTSHIYDMTSGGRIWWLTNGIGNINAAGDAICRGNWSGCGIRISDDGGIFDFNDAFLTFRATSGVRVHNGNSSGWAPVQASAFQPQSSREIKKDIVYLDTEGYNKALETLNSINVARYYFKWETGTGPKKMGVISEESPDFIQTEDKKAISLYDYAALIHASVKALFQKLTELAEEVSNIKELVLANQDKIAQQEKTIEAQQKQIDELEKRLQKLENNK